MDTKFWDYLKKPFLIVKKKKTAFTLWVLSKSDTNLSPVTLSPVTPCHLINSVDAEGSKVMDNLRNDAFKEIVKSLMKQ